jgi:hypothetical protein
MTLYALIVTPAVTPLVLLLNLKVLAFLPELHRHLIIRATFV